VSKFFFILQPYPEYEEPVKCLTDATYDTIFRLFISSVGDQTNQPFVQLLGSKTAYALCEQRFIAAGKTLYCYSTD
jgi:hypothetical protein